jgi:hypothetical protein
LEAGHWKWDLGMVRNRKTKIQKKYRNDKTRQRQERKEKTMTRKERRKQENK